ncbi:MAG TPA: hypothetical protein VF334_13935 [Polyangia bacterium]
MMLPVTDEEATALDELLDQKLRDMRLEIAHTDDRAYRSDLRDRYDHLERLRLRLKQMGTGSETYV